MSGSKSAGPSSIYDRTEEAAGRVPDAVGRHLPPWVRQLLVKLYWKRYDVQDYIAEAIGWVPSHILRLFVYRHVLKVRAGAKTSIHRGCRLYWPAGVRIGAHTVINRDVLLDGRMGLEIGSNVSISEGVAIFTLEHDPGSPDFVHRGAPVHVRDRVFVGARAMILPGVTLEEGSVVGAGAVVTRDVPAYQVVAGVPARAIGERPRDLHYVLDHRKFLG